MSAPERGAYRSSGDPTSRQMLEGWAARHGAPPALGCSLVAHRDLGLCSACRSPYDGKRNDPEREMAGWRLLAMAERGIPRQPWEPAASDDSGQSA